MSNETLKFIDVFINLFPMAYSLASRARLTPWNAGCNKLISEVCIIKSAKIKMAEKLSVLFELTFRRFV